MNRMNGAFLMRNQPTEKIHAGSIHAQKTLTEWVQCVPPCPERPDLAESGWRASAWPISFHCANFRSPGKFRLTGVGFGHRVVGSERWLLPSRLPTVSIG